MSNNKPKLIAFMNVYNEAEYIEYSLKSIYDVADKIYIVEGAFWETYLTNGNKQASDDGTIDIINNFPDKDNKIIHRGAPVGMNQLQQRNWGFGCINEKDEYWLWIVDGDEVYDESNLTNLKLVLSETRHDGIKINSYTFINDFNHYAPIAFPRLFRIVPTKSYMFYQPNEMLCEGEPVSIESYENDVVFWHYSYCKSSQRFLQKRNERLHVHGNFTWELDNNGEVHKTTSKSKGKKFNGDHPEIMKSHPKYIKK